MKSILSNYPGLYIVIFLLHIAFWITVRLFGPNTINILLYILQQNAILHEVKIKPKINGIKVSGKNIDVQNKIEKPTKKKMIGTLFAQQPAVI